ncbi:MAG: DUF934 domain-containing protein [Gammaproteobacteria bacterium]|nr:DUF934 domain-containing protein [Gammaproteobacteria bacterium]
MSIVISSGEAIKDEWVRINSIDLIDDAEHIIVDLEFLHTHWSQLEHAQALVGVELEVTDPIAEIEAYLPGLVLVVLSFDAFSDGRAFSQARMLRQRYAFEGDIRAQGEVLRDQLAFMQRCGINQFCLAEGEAVEPALTAFSDIRESYQPELK